MPSQSWEYLILTPWGEDLPAGAMVGIAIPKKVRPEVVEEALRLAGRSGWELVSAMEKFEGRGVWLLFKRPLEMPWEPDKPIPGFQAHRTEGGDRQP